MTKTQQNTETAQDDNTVFFRSECEREALAERSIRNSCWIIDEPIELFPLPERQEAVKEPGPHVEPTGMELESTPDSLMRIASSHREVPGHLTLLDVSPTPLGPHEVRIQVVTAAVTRLDLLRATRTTRSRKLCSCSSMHASDEGRGTSKKGRSWLRGLFRRGNGKNAAKVEDRSARQRAGIAQAGKGLRPPLTVLESFGISPPVLCEDSTEKKQKKDKLPEKFIPGPYAGGSDGSGIVMEVGELVQDLRVGDRVIFHISAEPFSWPEERKDSMGSLKGTSTRSREGVGSSLSLEDHAFSLRGEECGAWSRFVVADRDTVISLSSRDIWKKKTKGKAQSFPGNFDEDDGNNSLEEDEKTVSLFPRLSFQEAALMPYAAWTAYAALFDKLRIQEKDSLLMIAEGRRFVRENASLYSSEFCGRGVLLSDEVGFVAAQMAAYFNLDVTLLIVSSSDAQEQPSCACCPPSNREKAVTLQKTDDWSQNHGVKDPYVRFLREKGVQVVWNTEDCLRVSRSRRPGATEVVTNRSTSSNSQKTLPETAEARKTHQKQHRQHLSHAYISGNESEASNLDRLVDLPEGHETFVFDHVLISSNACLAGFSLEDFQEIPTEKRPLSRAPSSPFSALEDTVVLLLHQLLRPGGGICFATLSSPSTSFMEKIQGRAPIGKNAFPVLPPSSISKTSVTHDFLVSSPWLYFDYSLHFVLIHGLYNHPFTRPMLKQVGEEVLWLYFHGAFSLFLRDDEGLKHTKDLCAAGAENECRFSAEKFFSFSDFPKALNFQIQKCASITNPGMCCSLGEEKREEMLNHPAMFVVLTVHDIPSANTECAQVSALPSDEKSIKETPETEVTSDVVTESENPVGRRSASEMKEDFSRLTDQPFRETLAVPDPRNEVGDTNMEGPMRSRNEAEAANSVFSSTFSTDSLPPRSRLEQELQRDTAYGGLSIPTLPGSVWPEDD